MIAGRYDDEFAHVADVFRNQIARTDGGAAVAVYHRGRLVVDLWGGSSQPGWGGALDTRHAGHVLEHHQGRRRHLRPRARRPRGDLDYDERVATYWPEFAQKTARVTSPFGRY